MKGAIKADRLPTLLLFIPLIFILPLSKKTCNYGLRSRKNSSCLTKFLVNIIHIYGSKYICN
jgi:hypothetical protein